MRPDMATMLCFIMTDLNIQRKALSKALSAAAGGSFNAITVDGDTSPNDSVFILANGVLGNRQITEKSKHYGRFVDVLSSLCGEIAGMIVSGRRRGYEGRKDQCYGSQDREGR